MNSILESIAKVPYRGLQKILSSYGYQLMLAKAENDEPEQPPVLEIEDQPVEFPMHRQGINLNVGAGDYVILGFVSLDHYSEHYYPSKEMFLRERVEYDLRKDNLPYADDTVDNIYISHVIEHVETEHVVRFINESFRVLKPGGVLRVVCPDAKFLFEVSQFENEYFRWHPSYGSAGQVDMMIHQLATPRISKTHYGLPEDALGSGYEEFVAFLREGLAFDPLNPGNHINNWDYERIRKIALEAGFETVIQSKAGGSVSAALQGEDIDLAHRHMSLYVDLVKAD